MTLEIGAVLGRYRIESLVGRGGMGAVYLATDTQLDRRVALKVLSPELTDDQRFRDRFIAESRIAASLDHPNIVPVYEAGEIDGQLFIAMRYIDGHDLSDVLAERGALPIALAVRIIAAVAAALDAAHAKGLVHRDVKPGNVLLAGPDEAPHVYLTDFGLTKRIGDQSMTAAGQIVGSIGYVAPEQVEGRAVDARTDVYSLGCLAFELLAGAQPFRRDSEMAVLMAHVQDPPPSLLAQRPELPEALDAAIAQAMAKDPGGRFASAGQFAAGVTEAVHPEGGALTRGFLFADLRGYTAYVEGHGDAAASALLDVYRRLMRDTIAHHGGAEIKTEGDSFYVVFPSASGAVMCGLSVVAAAAQSQAHPEQPIRVGVGVNAGEAVAAAEGYVGSAVNIAARVCTQSKPGEVLVTDTVRGLTRTSGRLTFVPVGRRTLKGIAEPVALFRAELAGSGLIVAPGGGGPIWRRPSVLAGVGGLAVLALAVVVAGKAGFGPGGSSPSAAASPSLPPAVPVERIAYTQVRSSDPAADPSCGDMVEGRAVLYDLLTGRTTRITHGGDASETHVAWSSNRSQLAFVGFSFDAGGFAVYLMNVATGETTRLLPKTVDGLDPFYASIDSVSWSADGTQLLFGWGQEIRVVGADGSDFRSLDITMPTYPATTPDPDGNTFDAVPIPVAPVWLQDGRVVAILDDQIGGRTLAATPADGGELTPLSWVPPALNIAAAAWSPDRTRVAFVGADFTKLSGDEAPVWDLYIAGADGSDLRQIASAHGIAADPAWSPDGTQIVFGSGKLYTVKLDSGEVSELPGTPGFAACWPSWGRTTTASLPQPTPTLAPGSTPAPAPFHDGLLDPGVYVTDVFLTPFQFEVPGGWQGIRNYLDYLVIAPTDLPGAAINVAIVRQGVVAPCDGLEELPKTARPLRTPEDLMAFLQQHPNLKVVNPAPYNLTRLGLNGWSMEISISPPPTQADCPERPVAFKTVEIVRTGQDGYVVDVSQRVKVLALATEDGKLLAFFLEAPTDQYDAFQVRAQKILDSLTFP